MSEESTLSAAEKRALKERTAELRAQARRMKAEEKAATNLQAVLDAIDALPDDERSFARRVHEIVLAAAPQLEPRTWYGMPAYALDGAIVCFLQPASKFGARYATFGFNDSAQLDDGSMWPISYALAELTPDTEALLASLVRRAVTQ